MAVVVSTGRIMINSSAADVANVIYSTVPRGITPGVLTWLMFVLCIVRSSDGHLFKLFTLASIIDDL